MSTLKRQKVNSVKCGKSNKSETKSRKLKKATNPEKVQTIPADISKVPSAVVFLVYKFFTLKDHCNLASVSTRFHNIAKLPGSSPIEIRIPNNLYAATSVKRLFQFKSSCLKMFVGHFVKLQKQLVDNSGKLHKLVLKWDHTAFNLDADNFQTLPKLTQLTTLFLPFDCTPHLPPSLTELSIPSEPKGKELFAPTLKDSLFGTRQLTALQTLKLPVSSNFPFLLSEIGLAFSNLRRLEMGISFFGNLGLLQNCSFLEHLSISFQIRTSRYCAKV